MKQANENVQETMLLRFTGLDDMFVFTFACALELIIPPFIPGHTETVSQLVEYVLKECAK